MGRSVASSSMLKRLTEISRLSNSTAYVLGLLGVISRVSRICITGTRIQRNGIILVYPISGDHSQLSQQPTGLAWRQSLPDSSSTMLGERGECLLAWLSFASSALAARGYQGTKAGQQGVSSPPVPGPKVIPQPSRLGGNKILA